MLLGQIKSIPRLITTDEYKPYKKAILETYGTEVIPSRTGRPGRPKKPYKVPKNDLLYATVHKHRRRGRVVKVDTNLIYGTKKRLTKALKDSSSSKSVNLSFIERYNGTDRHQNSRKTRKTYAFSKDWDIHNAFEFGLVLPITTFVVPIVVFGLRLKNDDINIELQQCLLVWLTISGQ